MATGSTLTEVSLSPTKDPSPGASTSFSSSRFFSKIARSPTTSRSHRPLPSQGSGSGSDTVATSLPAASQSAQTQGAQHSRRNQPRPGFQRQFSAPDTSLIQRTKDAEGELKHHSDATGDTATQARAMLIKPVGTSYSVQSPPNATGKGIQQQQQQQQQQPQMFSAPLVSEYYLLSQGPNAPNGLGSAVNYMYQQMQELALKRIATLQYMRKAYEGKMFWFNTVHFPRKDIEKFPSHMPNRLSRRATNYFLLGISIPAVVDVHQVPHASSSPQMCASVAGEMLKSLNILLTEFENYQEKHPIDGSHAGSLSRARLPSMFKRSGTTSRPRKSSIAPSMEIGAQISPPAVPDGPHHQLHHSTNPSIDTTASTAITSSSTSTLVNQPSFTGTLPINNFSATATFPPPGSADAPNSTLLASESVYTHLLTPPLPFAPDFYTVFASLCDVLIETYQRLLQIINGPSACTATVTEAFSKADAKIRKVIVGGIVKDFETASRENTKRELAGVQKVVLGGLMG